MSEDLGEFYCAMPSLACNQYQERQLASFVTQNHVYISHVHAQKDRKTPKRRRMQWVDVEGDESDSINKEGIPMVQS
jgi:hypothetical protein